jgi:hypothetical protein
MSEASLTYNLANDLVMQLCHRRGQMYSQYGDVGERRGQPDVNVDTSWLKSQARWGKRHNHTIVVLRVYSQAFTSSEQSNILSIGRCIWGDEWALRRRKQTRRAQRAVPAPAKQSIFPHRSYVPIDTLTYA